MQGCQCPFIPFKRSERYLYTFQKMYFERYFEGCFWKVSEILHFWQNTFQWLPWLNGLCLLTNILGFPVRPCGQGIPFPSNLLGMVPGPSLLFSFYKERGVPVRRPLRDLGKSPVLVFCLRMPRPQCLDGGWFFVWLDFLKFYLGFSTFSVHRRGGEVFNVLQWGWLLDSPPFASKGLGSPFSH